MDAERRCLSFLKMAGMEQLNSGDIFSGILNLLKTALPFALLPKVVSLGPGGFEELCENGEWNE